MIKSFNKFKKPVFGPFLVYFPKFFSPENPALSHTTLYGFLASCQNSEKTNDAIPMLPPGVQKRDQE